MRRAARKLKSRRGASIIIALLVMLICITAGTAALTAASANAGRYTHMAEDQQRYLAVSSAVKLIREELCGRNFTAMAEMEENRLPSDETEQPTFQLDVTSSYDGVFEPWLKEPLEELFRADAVPEEWWANAGLAFPTAAGGTTYSGLAVETDSDEPLLGQVRWELKLEEDYTITARFWLEDDGERYYPTVLTLPAAVEETTSDPQRVGAGQRWRTTKTLTARWDEAEAVIGQG